MVKKLVARAVTAGGVAASLMLAAPAAHAAEAVPGTYSCAGQVIDETFVGRAPNLDDAVYNARIQTQGYYIYQETATEYWNGWEVDDHTIHCVR